RRPQCRRQTYNREREDDAQSHAHCLTRSRCRWTRRVTSGQRRMTITRNLNDRALAADERDETDGCAASDFDERAKRNASVIDIFSSGFVGPIGLSWLSK